VIRKHDWIWTSSLALSACANANAHRDTYTAPDVLRTSDWSRCCEADTALPGVMTQGSGDSLQCLCPAGAICNFGRCFLADAAAPDAGMDASAHDDGGFAEAGPMDDASLDALVVDDALIVDDAESP
jgi:hypothetical protein